MPTTTPLTPIDTGEVAEPHVWRTTRPAYMGRVDFDNDEGSTLATVRMERNELADQIIEAHAHHDDDPDDMHHDLYLLHLGEEQWT